MFHCNTGCRYSRLVVFLVVLVGMSVGTPTHADVNRLGSNYRPEATTFAIWSPDTSDVGLVLDGATYPMPRVPDGNGYTDVYAVTVPGNHHLKRYHFRIAGQVARDPYGVMVEPATDNNIVVNLALTEPAGGWVPRPQLIDREDAVIYEVHVRDFTIDETSGVDPSKRGKFLGMVQAGTQFQGKKTGLDHLKELGITHVQMLPIYDFNSCSARASGDIGPSCYNWGYDPVNFNVPEERYSLVANNPVERIRELKNMINEFHKSGIRVIMDVVYNHTVEPTFKPISSKYFTAQDLSGTGNSVNDRIPMVSRFIRDSLEFWVREYHLDGFRFDLIGVFDYDAVGDWARYLNEQFADATLLIYGEPWNGFANDPEEPQRVRLGTVARIADGHVGVFNPKYRDALKGNLNDGQGGGYVFNQLNDLFPIRVGSRGAIRFNNDPTQPIDTWDQMFAIDPEQTINYVSAHDNLTLRDKILAWAQLNNATGQSGYLRRIQEFANGIILTSQGIPLLHAGEEMMRDKQGEHDSYNKPDAINKIRWSWKVDSEDVFKYYQQVVAIRRAHPGFRLNSWQEITQNVQTSSPRYGLIVNRINASVNGDSWPEIIAIYNSADNYQFPLPPGKWRVAMEKSDPAAGNGRQVEGGVTAEGTAVTVLYRE